MPSLQQRIDREIARIQSASSTTVKEAPDDGRSYTGYVEEGRWIVTGGNLSFEGTSREMASALADLMVKHTEYARLLDKHKIARA